LKIIHHFLEEEIQQRCGPTASRGVTGMGASLATLSMLGAKKSPFPAAAAGTRAGQESAPQARGFSAQELPEENNGGWLRS